ncbi:MAG: hypothetical protein HOV79_25710 [Hamadaea sp.]|nr:hypothetical protein [Hamadaea sp.]
MIVDRPAELDRLDVLVGVWESEATFDAGFFGPGSPEVKGLGRTAFEWMEGGRFLLQRFTNEHPDAPDGLTVIGLSEGGESTFVQNYFDSRGVARVYRMEIDGREWRLWRYAPGFSQRFAGVIAADGRSIAGAWEASEDGQTWRHDFRLTYARIG